MSLNRIIAYEPPASRRWRRWAPLLLLLGLIVLTLMPGAISGDRPFQISLCGDQAGGLEACAQQWRAALAERNLVR
jgi:hypothetical protein